MSGHENLFFGDFGRRTRRATALCSRTTRRALAFTRNERVSTPAEGACAPVARRRLAFRWSRARLGQPRTTALAVAEHAHEDQLLRPLRSVQHREREHAARDPVGTPCPIS